MVAILLGSLFKRRSKTSMLYYAYWYQWGRCGQRMIELSAEYQCQPRATFITQIQTNRDDLSSARKGNPSFFFKSKSDFKSTDFSCFVSSKHISLMVAVVV